MLSGGLRMSGKIQKKKIIMRNKEIVSIRMRIGIKKEIDIFCEKNKITRNNFIINCILKELMASKNKKNLNFLKNSQILSYNLL